MLNKEYICKVRIIPDFFVDYFFGKCSLGVGSVYRDASQKHKRETKTKEQKENTMDPSMFSINEANRVLNPHLKNLPFSSEAELLDITVIGNEEGEVFELKTWKGMLMVPMGFDPKGRFFRIEVDREFMKGPTGRVRIKCRNLLLEREKSGGLHIKWYLESLQFTPNKSSGSNMFDLVSGEIKYIRFDDSSVIKTLPADFPARFWKQVLKWVNDSVERRFKVIKELERLEAQCEERCKELIDFK